MLRDKLDDIEKSKNKRTNNLKISSAYKKGDLFYEIINSWNNLPPNIKEIPDKYFKSKKKILNYINSEYDICKLKNCEACALSPVVDI